MSYFFQHAILIFFAVIVGFGFGLSSGSNHVMRQAYERGHAVQCPGKTGYHWECEEPTNER